jgi:capsular exopolysaccharide synthesis family protein
LDQQEADFSQLSRRYLPKHPRMIATTETLSDLKDRFMAEFKIAITSPADKDYWKTVESEIQKAENDPDLALKTARQLLLARTGILKGETASQMSVFNSMLTRLEESNVNREGNESAAEISSFARNPGWAHWPQPRQIYTTGGMFGLAGGALIALILTRLDNKFRTVAQVEAETSLTVFAAISDIDVRLVDKAVRAKLRRNKDVVQDPLQGEWDARLLFRPGASTTTFAEMFRILRASVSLLGDEATRKVTLYSSALPGEGKSLVSANFALAAAGQGRKTLLIDLDLRKPSLHKVFGFTRNENGAGATELLASQVSLDEATTKEVGCENLHVVFSGSKAPNPGELLNTKRLKELFAAAAQEYDLIVVDSAPLLPVPDTRVLVQLSDNFCLVVRSNYAPKGAVARALELLATAGTMPAGLVFNGYKETRRMISQNYSYGGYRMSRYGRPYQYGYGTYGAYGEDDNDDDTKEILKRRQKKKSRFAKDHEDSAS